MPITKFKCLQLSSRLCNYDWVTLKRKKEWDAAGFELLGNMHVDVCMDKRYINDAQFAHGISQ